jgi:hypothetical protein
MNSGRLGASLLAAFLTAAQWAGAQASPPSLSAARVTAQITLGTIATPIGFFGGGLAARELARAVGGSDETARRAAYVGAFGGAWIAAAAVPAWVGSDGRVGAALAGSAGGLIVAAVSAKLGNHLYDQGRNGCGPLCWVLGALAVSSPGVGATLAYNASR